MITALDLVRLQVGIYAYPDEPPFQWDAVAETSGVYWGLKVIENINVVVLRGSTTIPDWIRDFESFAIAKYVHNFGGVHPGFFDGTPFAWAAIYQAAYQNSLKAGLHLAAMDWIFVGHSLGAGHANMLCRHAQLQGLKPRARVVFGEPKPGLDDFCNFIDGIPSWSFCNGGADGHDLVTNVPFTFPPEDYTRPAPLIPVPVKPADNDPWGPFRYHHARLYRDGIAARDPVPIIADANAPGT